MLMVSESISKIVRGKLSQIMFFLGIFCFLSEIIYRHSIVCECVPELKGSPRMRAVYVVALKPSADWKPDYNV